VSSNSPDQPAEAPVVVDPATVRRAPKYPAFLLTGAVVGIAAGLWLGLYLVANVDPLRDMPVLKPGVFIVVTMLGAATFTTLVAGLLAVLADRRSLRKARRR
jgi:Mg/Co/Ni transporter MgtE